MRYIYADISLLCVVSHGIDIFYAYDIIANIESGKDAFRNDFYLHLA